MSLPLWRGYAGSVLGLAFIASALGCDEANHTDVALTGHDLSVGREIVVIGRSDTVEGHLLNNVRGGFWREDVGLLLGDAGSGEIRTFDRTGALVDRMGRLGSGPGEFRFLDALWSATGDTVVAFDPINGRISYWVPGSGLVLEQTIEGPISLLDATNGILVGAIPPKSALDTPVATRLDSATVLRLNVAPDGIDSSTLISLPWRTFLTVEAPTGQPLGMPHPLEAQSVVAQDDSVIYVGYGARWQVERVSPNGDILSPVSVTSVSRRSLTDELIQLWKTPLLARVAAIQRPAMRRYLNSVPLPDTLPAYDQMLVDELGYLWLRRFTVPGENESVWIIVSAEGDLLGRLQLPATTRPLQIGPDHITLHAKPPEGSEEVGVYALHR